MAFNGVLPITSFEKIRRRVQKFKFTNMHARAHTHAHARAHTHTHTHTLKHGILNSHRPTTVVLGIKSRLKMFGKEESQPPTYHVRPLSHGLSKYLYCTYCADY